MITEGSQYAKILTTIVENPNVDWWFPYDFMKSNLGDLFVGYEASARFSELNRRFPTMFENRRDGKYIKRRFQFENSEDFKYSLPIRLQVAICLVVCNLNKNKKVEKNNQKTLI